jgi:hypothetical protein
MQDQIHASLELEELVKAHGITVEKTKALSEEIETVLEESKHYRLMHNLLMYHSKKEFTANNKSI